MTTQDMKNRFSGYYYTKNASIAVHKHEKTKTVNLISIQQKYLLESTVTINYQQKECSQLVA